MFDLNQDHNSKLIIGKFLSGEIKKLEPRYDPQTGYHYSQIEEILGDPSEVETLLDRLVDAGMLERSLFDKIILCRKCNSANVALHYCCPYCKSFNIKKSALVEHVRCGYMDIESNFKQGNTYVCPKCHEQMRTIDVDYRKAGVWCTCNNCNKNFDIPISENFCRQCSTNSTFEEATIKDIYAYTLSKDIQTESYQNTLIALPIQEFFTTQGLTVQPQASLEGKSGAKHTFDLIAYKENPEGPKNLTVVDVAISSSETISEQPVIALFAKVFDVNPEKAFLIAIPRLNNNAKRMAQSYNIMAIEANNSEEAAKVLKASFNKK